MFEKKNSANTFFLSFYALALIMKTVYFCLSYGQVILGQWESVTNRWKQFRELFRFREDIQSQSSKIACPRSQQIRGQANFSLDTDIFII